MLDVYYMTIDTVSPEMRDTMLSTLSEGEAEHCRKRKRERDFLLSLCGHYMMKNVTGRDDVLYNKAGKPYYEGGPFISLSHDENTVVLAVSDVPCGVDILFATEARKAKISQVVGRFVHDIYKGLSLSSDQVSFYRVEVLDNERLLSPCSYTEIPEESGEYAYARAFTKAEALMKCDGGGFAAITLLCQLKQTLETLSVALPDLPDAVVTLARTKSPLPESTATV